MNGGGGTATFCRTLRPPTRGWGSREGLVRSVKGAVAVASIILVACTAIPALAAVQCPAGHCYGTGGQGCVQCCMSGSGNTSGDQSLS